MNSQEDWDSLYERDEAEWVNRMIGLLEAGKLNEIDSTNLRVVLSEMVHSDKKTIVSKLTTLIMHLLKWKYQPEKQTRSWRVTINRERREIHRLIGDSKNLLKYSEKVGFDTAFEDAVTDAREETGMDIPRDQVFTYKQVMSDDFWP